MDTIATTTTTEKETKTDELKDGQINRHTVYSHVDTERLTR